MEVWSWVLVVVALVLLGAGTLRFDLLVAAFRQRFGAAPSSTPAPARGAGGHGAAAHTGHVPGHPPARRKPAVHRSGKRH